VAFLLAFGANFIFAFSATLFTDFSREVSGKWINSFKLIIAFICFGLTALILQSTPIWSIAPYFMLSGALGLFCADHFLCSAFAKLGSARTLMIFSFSPIFVATWSYFLFQEKPHYTKFIAIFFFIACVFTLSIEKFRKEGHWEIPGLLMALFGIILDGLGNVTTRYALNINPNESVMNVCAMRALGAFFGFLLFQPILKTRLVDSFQKLSRRKKVTVLIASSLGTYVSLTFWISAVKIGNLTSLIALSGTTPLLAGMFEIAMGKTKATRYLAYAFGLFAIGFYFLIKN